MKNLNHTCTCQHENTRELRKEINDIWKEIREIKRSINRIIAEKENEDEILRKIAEDFCDNRLD